MPSSQIIVEPNTVERTIPGYRDAFTGERRPAETITERNLNLPWRAHRGVVQAAARTKQGAIEMVERIEQRRAQ